jgi:hypothetical protein
LKRKYKNFMTKQNDFIESTTGVRGPVSRNSCLRSATGGLSPARTGQAGLAVYKALLGGGWNCPGGQQTCPKELILADLRERIHSGGLMAFENKIETLFK